MGTSESSWKIELRVNFGAKVELHVQNLLTFENQSYRGRGEGEEEEGTEGKRKGGRERDSMH